MSAGLELRHDDEDEDVAAPALDPVEWTVNPWKENAPNAAIAVFVLALVPALLVRVGFADLTGIVLFLVLGVTMAPAFTTLRCRVDEDGVSRRLLFVWERRPWDRIGQARLGPLGLWVGPRAMPRALASFRGLWMPVPGGDREVTLIAEIRRRLHRHGF